MDQTDDKVYPLTTRKIAEAQREDAVYAKYFSTAHERFRPVVIDDVEILVREDLEGEQYKLVIPGTLRKRALQWYHHFLQHPGATRLEQTLAQIFW